MTLLTKAGILAAEDLKSRDVPVPEWGGTVRVRVMTGIERDAFGASMVDAAGKPNMAHYQTRLIAACLVDETGAVLFTEGDVEALGQKSGAALQRVFKAAEDVNGLATGAVETAAGN